MYLIFNLKIVNSDLWLFLLSFSEFCIDLRSFRPLPVTSQILKPLNAQQTWKPNINKKLKWVISKQGAELWKIDEKSVRNRKPFHQIEFSRFHQRFEYIFIWLIKITEWLIVTKQKQTTMFEKENGENHLSKNSTKIEGTNEWK